MAITKIIASRHNHRTTLIPFPGGVDDGSTLSLDFTTGVLDPRLTFTRTSDATFINSSGLVQWAAVNHFRNTGWTTTTTPSQWGLLFGTGTVTWHGDGSVTMDTGVSSTRPAIYVNPAVTVIQGIQYTFGYRVLAVSGSPQISNVITSNIVGETFAINGTTVASSTVVQAGDVVSCTFTTTGTTLTPRLGPGSIGGMTNTSMRITQPQMNPGVTLQPYLLNTSTSVANNNTPRFDHDPTTLAPRGLLIEGQATNLLNWSESFATSGGTNNNWADTNITRNSTNNTDPANGTSALRVTASAGNGTIISTAAMGTSAQRTFSIWLRRVSGTGDIQYTLDNGSTYTTQAITSSWVRYTFAATTAAQRVGIRIVTSGDSIELWGAQLEASSGASSYIPTGASQVTRTQELLSMTGTGLSWFSNSYSEGTFLFRGSIINTASGYARIAALSQSANFGDATGAPSFNFGVAASASNRPFLNAWVTANNNVDIYVPVGAAVTSGVEFAIAAAYKASDWRISSKNLAATSTFASVGTTWGNNFFMSGINGIFFPALWYKQLKFFPIRLSNAQMDAWSA